MVYSFGRVFFFIIFFFLELLNNLELYQTGLLGKFFNSQEDFYDGPFASKFLSRGPNSSLSGAKLAMSFVFFFFFIWFICSLMSVSPHEIVAKFLIYFTCLLIFHNIPFISTIGDIWDSCKTFCWYRYSCEHVFLCIFGLYLYLYSTYILYLYIIIYLGTYFLWFDVLGERII